MPLQFEMYFLTSPPGNIQTPPSSPSPPPQTMVYKAFLLGLIVFVLPPFASSTDIPATSIHNCSGTADPAPTTYKPYFPSYGPQLSGDLGWEEWTFVLPDTLNRSMFHFRWTRGNPADPTSDPQTATFSAYYEKTGFRADVSGPFMSNIVGDSSLSISTGKNYLSFDGTKGPFGFWNVSVDIEGLKATVVVVLVAPSVPFEPALNDERGLLVPGYHVSHPVYRGHTNGIVVLPSGQFWAIREVATLKHAYAYASVQSLMSTYTRVSTFVGPSTLNWYVAEGKTGRDTTAAGFVYGALDLSEITLKYQITNEPHSLTISSSISSQTRDYKVTLAGCEETLNNPYTFDSTSQVYLGAITDSAGGRTEYWSLQTHVLFFIDGQPWTNNNTIGSLGLLEVYTCPLY
ncbi:hypothetical protein BDM02DRAFT_2993722 [Thelephora ganbajun]|uniref:Uncharacterized protein n=1 Tax=Thelephora ganbajun TaxID=370292 RepID=A0ACB6ZAL2_THEGA|nr:hypothetical protein BDM02DRAFT_2993722 [Thelephora ganbajun]